MIAVLTFVLSVIVGYFVALFVEGYVSDLADKIDSMSEEEYADMSTVEFVKTVVPAFVVPGFVWFLIGYGLLRLVGLS